MISFKALTIGTVELKKITHNNRKTKSYEGNFVELNPDSTIDYKAMRAIGLGWDKGGSFAGDMFDLFAKERICDEKHKDANHRFFAITKNNSIAPYITAHDILGVATLTKEKDNTQTLKYVQVDPEQVYGSSRRVYKHIGKALVEAIQNLSNISEIKLYAVDFGAELFYEKLNFKKLKNSIYMHYKR